MPELRRNLLTGDWIVLAADRAHRVHDHAAARAPRPVESFLDSCPFCPGNEARSDAAVLEVSGPAGWDLRVVPNKFPALQPAAREAGGGDPMFPRQTGFGYHEVLVESRRHDGSLGLMPLAAVEQVLRAFLTRYRVLREDPRVAYVVLFKNHGAEAGCSLDHPHSQIVATPVVPPEVSGRLATARAFHAAHGECLACRLLEAELASGERIVDANDDFVAYIPFAAYSPYHSWIFPRAHQASFGEITAPQLANLARCVRTLLHKVHAGLGDPDYNLMVRSVPGSSREAPYWHWYVTLVPRVSRQAGFELGSGMFINTALPEDSARVLRQAPGPRDDGPAGAQSTSSTRKP